VIICDGVGTHLGYHVVKKAIELGIEILLRVPHLSFVLQGEDTVNFKVTACFFTTCLRAAAAFAYACAVDAANAYADADVTRSDADAHPTAFDAAAYATAMMKMLMQTCRMMPVILRVHMLVLLVLALMPSLRAADACDDVMMLFNSESDYKVILIT
jgi:hypothetical protein